MVSKNLRDSLRSSTAQFFISLTSKRHFPLMGPFTFFYFPEWGGPGPPLNRPLGENRQGFRKGELTLRTRWMEAEFRMVGHLE